LTEAIALGHDLGHTPFGHVGEDVLNELYHEGFKHNEQSLRVVDLLEKDGQGLNLTWEVRDGIVNHSKTRGGIFHHERGEASTLEGGVCKIADAVAYINHDIGDAIRAGIITERDLPLPAIGVLGCFHSQRINTMVCDIIECSWAVRGSSGISGPEIGMSSLVLEATDTLRDFLFNRVYSLRSSREKTERVRELVRLLYDYFNVHEDKLPPEYRFYSDETERRVVDYIAGMTDQYAMRLAEGL
jgi:dGTPase